MHQPATSDVTSNGLRKARNAMRLKLWNDGTFAHRYLCHPERECEDGCDVRAIPSRLALYTSAIED